jgi:hypothetical protein
MGPSGGYPAWLMQSRTASDRDRELRMPLVQTHFKNLYMDDTDGHSRTTFRRAAAYDEAERATGPAPK